MTRFRRGPRAGRRPRQFAGLVLGLGLLGGQAAAQRSAVEFADPHMTGYRYDGPFVLRFYDAMDTDTSPCPTSPTMLTASVAGGLQTSKPEFVHAVTVGNDTPAELKAAIDGRAACTLAVEGAYVLAVHHGRQLQVTARRVTPLPD